jgi:branched-chain amino acid aminotransferase
METITQKILIQKTEDSRLSSETLHNIPFGRIFSDHIFIATYDNGTWQDLKIIPYGNLTMTPAMAILHYGQAVFEGMKAYKSATGETLIFRPDANFRRINQSAHRLCMPPIPEAIFMAGLTELIRLDSGWIPESEGSLYIRPLYFATDEFIGLKPSTHYTFIIMSCPVGAYYSEPVKLIVTDKYIRACEGGTGAAKCAGNYAASLLADKEAKVLGYDSVIWLDDVVVTPKLTGTILEGITRDSVLTLFRDQGVQVEERLISIEEVAESYDKGILQEAFGMGTAATIAQVSKIGYQGRDLILPPISERKYGQSILEQLEAIKTGKTPDPHNWVHKI